jgi:3-phenylpropionate/cinnamic acid dioxygenase small subunit
MSDKPQDALARLVAEAGIRHTLARYCHTIDDGDFDALGECFTPDAELAAFGRTRNGREAATALLAKAMPADNRGKHLIANISIGELRSGADGTARASVLSDFAFVGKDGSVTTGRYADEFVSADGGWLIGKREIALGGS